MSFIKKAWGWVNGEEVTAASGGSGTPSPGTAAVQVLVVCTGNICRSPTGEGVLRAKLARAGLGSRVLVDSAGTHGYHTSEPPDPRAVQAAAKRGYDIARLKARPVVPADFQRFDWILAMDEGHLAWLQRKAPAGSRARLELLMDHARRFPGLAEVPDPYYGPLAGFEHVLDLVEDAAEGVVERLRAGTIGKA